MICMLFLVQIVFAQTKVTGTITDAGTKEPLIGVSVQVKGKVLGTITDAKGNFSLSTATPVPFTLTITSVGYETQEVSVSSDNANLNIALKEQVIMGQEVVVAASRVEESVLKSPVTVEKMDLRAIRETPAASFYDGLAAMKGIDMATQSLLFKSVNMRGFGSTGNPRTVQMIDGMDNQAPGLNFPVDNIVGMPELDVESVEVLPGAASALYGPNALNGLILMNSKSPFLYQGLSATVKAGIMSADNRPTVNTPFSDYSIRYAKAFNNKFAFKVNLSYIQAKDWMSTDYTNLNVGGNADPSRGPGTRIDYDGMNTYGDEVQANMQTVANSLVANRLLPQSALALIPNSAVSRTGYMEKDLFENNTKSFKFNGALHYRLTEKIEAIAQVNYGYGTTGYTGTGRYSLRNFNLTQAKLELRGDNFTLRAYTTQERSGQSYLSGLAAVSILNEATPHATWFGTYVGAFAQARGAGLAEEAAHLAARRAADANMPTVGSERFNTLYEKYRTTSIANGGSSFDDRTNLYHAEGVYNFKNQIKFIDLLVGANVRQFQLRSNGTLFADLKEGRDGTIPINEYGAFVQAGKSLFKDHLKLVGSLRYDKNQNFEGQFSPRISAVASFAGDNNIRVSYQTGFRIPTTQNQYIDLLTPNARLIGGLSEFDSRYNLSRGVSRETLIDFSTNPTKYITPAIIAQAQAYATAAVQAQLPAIQAAVTQAVQAQLPTIQAGVTAAVQAQVTAGVTAQVNAAVAAGQIPANQAAAAIAAGVAAQMATTAVQNTIATNVQSTVTSTIATNVQNTVVQQVTAVTTQVAPAYALATLPKYQARALTPERVQSIEVGYKGLIGKKLFIDASYYNSVYRNFIGGVVVLVPTAAAAPGLPIESGLGGGSTRAVYSRPANSNSDITVTGFSLALNYSLPKNFFVGGNFANNTLKNFTPTPELPYSGFNTPRNRFNLNFGRRMGSGSKYGFNIAFKHQESFTWESSFVVPTTTGVPLFGNTVVPAVNNLDAQFSYKLTSFKSILKVGATNLFGNPYIQAYGSPSIGTMYYVSLAFDELLNK
ncbi:MAG: carboxypeptidase-like regulatory domain-containing protein [Spirosomaceae bacterium]|nr:carboxypeptidase-like regulatory domain-containing protein [Spirosomataceae bacterium]